MALAQLRELVAEAEGTAHPAERPHGPGQTVLQFLREAEEPEAEDCAADAVLEAAQAYCELLKAARHDADEALRTAEDIRAQYAAVTTDSRSLHDTCERLMAEQAQLELQVGQLEPLLAHFNELSSIGNLLGLPLTSAEDSGEMVVSSAAQISPASDEFRNVLSRLDAAVAFFVSHPHFAEASTYLSKMRQLQRRALSLLRSHVVAVIEGVSSKLMAARSNSLEESSPLFVRFRAVAAQVGQWTQQIESRVGAPDTAFAPLVRDCHEALYDARLALLLPLVRGRLGELSAQHDVLGLARVGCRALLGVCSAERRLFADIFESPPAEVGEEGFVRVVDTAHQGLNAMLGELCAVLYALVRPRAIHELDLDILCELIDVLRGELGDDVGDVALQSVLGRLVQDTQERLIYCTEMYIRDHIRGFSPSADDLDYPARLERLSAAATADAEAQENEAEEGEDVVTVYATWYPTVERTLMCLSKIYRCVDMSIFEGLAQEAVAVCTASLLAAVPRVAAGPDGAVDRTLFLVHNLLTLREQITPFDVDFCSTTKTLDFSSTTGALAHFLGNAGSSTLFSFSTDNPLFSLLVKGIPRVTETHADSKQDLERQLKLACSAYIEEVSRSLLTPLPAAVAVDGAGDGAEEGEARKRREEALATQISQVTALVNDAIGGLRQKLRLYLSNSETETILFRPVQAAVLEAARKHRPQGVVGEALESAYSGLRAALAA